MFIDTHAHLNDKAFEEDVNEIIKLSNEMGVKNIINSGYNLSSSINAVKLAEKHQGLYASIGFYPENIHELDEESYITLENLAKHEKVVAIGEIGLQYTEGCADKEMQKEGFIKLLQLAFNLEKPVVVHCRDAYGDMVELLKEHKQLLKFGGTFHCYSGSKEIANEIVKLGFHISVGGVSTFKNADRLREVISNVPTDKILLETDCPYLAPHPFRGKRNSPVYIPTIAENLAVIKGLTVEEVGKITTENARRLFKI